MAVHLAVVSVDTRAAKLADESAALWAAAMVVQTVALMDTMLVGRRVEKLVGY